ncbi:MAG: histidine phosphatase family protein [Chitinophagaceae bacterium]|nr:histidine phosphatase family protein [Chitinophagaceae bacterium]
MKNLILVRHAKSSWKDTLLNDHDRTLNKRGERDAPFMAKVLKKRKVTPDLIVTSTATRALSTAKIFAAELEYKKQLIEQSKHLYLADLDALMEFVTLLPDEKSTVAIFGHNPGITWLVNFFSVTVIENMPTCGICSLRFSVNNWKEVSAKEGQLLFFEFPKLYFKDSDD